MKRTCVGLACLVCQALVIGVFAGCTGKQGSPGRDGQDGQDGQSVAIGYVGSSECNSCHAEQYAAWSNSGHPYKIVSVASILAGTGYPEWVRNNVHGEPYAVDADFFSDPAGALLSVNANTFPSGGWDDVTYVIGGYGWKARFIDNNGYIITGTDHGTASDKTDDDKVQYNVPLSVDAFGAAAYTDVAASSSTYETGTQKPYDCGECHTTGWVPDADAATDNDLSDNQDGLPGIHGTWVEPGIGCEGCHGPSAGHVEEPYLVPPPWNAGDACSRCHVRSDPYEIDTKGNFIQHHEQFEEVIESKHAALECKGCHQPHHPVRYGETYVALEGTAADPNPDFQNIRGVRFACTTCHFRQKAAYDTWAAATDVAMTLVACEQCHMPKVTKSAVKAGTFAADTATHLFGINIAVDPIANPGLSTAGASPANPYISLEFACGSCHSDTAAGTDTANPDFYLWATTALTANGGVHGN